MTVCPQPFLRRVDMHSYEIRFPGFDARSNRGLIRWELFLHRDVRDVLLTTREDTLQVVFRGEPDTTRWSQTLVEAVLRHASRARLAMLSSMALEPPPKARAASFRIRQRVPAAGV